MRILLTNDDGIFAPGIRALRRSLRTLGDVTVIAPASEQSAVGHGVTLMHPLMVQRIEEHGEFIGYAVDGKPADCVKLGLVQLFGSPPPDLVVSGINAGANVGIDVLYSGTVAAAIEGAFCEITSIAVSLEMPETAHYDQAAKIAVGVIRKILDHRPEAGELFNINIPELSNGPPKGIRVVPHGLVCYRESYESRIDPRGRNYYWLLPDCPRPPEQLETDLSALAAGYITLTPLQFDLTAHRRLQQVAAWDLGLGNSE